MAESINRSMSYSEPRRVTSSPPPVDLSSMACGRLERGGDTAQCVIVRLPDMSAALGVVPPYNPLYGLLTCHHVLPTFSDSAWKLVLGPHIRDKYQLSRSKILRLLSCCGPNGLWQSEVHVPLPGNQAAGLCPVRADWTLAILQPAFVNEIQRGHDYFFPLITPFTPEVLKTAVEKKNCRIFERKPDGTIVHHFIDINPAISQPKDGRQQLENEVCSYREMSVLRYPMTFLSTIKAGCSGAPIFCQVSSSMATSDSLESLLLIGIHSSSPNLSASSLQSGNVEQRGVATLYILYSAIKDGAYCSLCACLAFVLEAMRQNKCLALSMEKLLKHLIKHRQNMQRTHVTNQSSQVERKKQIASSFELAEFILGVFPENIRMLKYQTLKQDKETSLLYMNVLSAAFSCFEGYEASELRVAAVGSDGVNLPVMGHVEDVCRSLYALMKSLKDYSSITPDDLDVVRMGFQLWWSVFHFNIVGGPVDTVLNDSASYSIVNEIRMRDMFEDDAFVQRMFGNISVAYQSKMRRDNANDLIRQLEEQKAELEEKWVKEVTLLRAELQKGAVEVKMKSEEARVELEDQFKKATNTIALLQIEKAKADDNWAKELQKEKMCVCELTSRLKVLNGCPTEGSPGSCSASQNGHSNSISSTHQDFWSQDIHDVLQRRPSLCSKVASFFEKVKGAYDGSWEHLMTKMKIELDKKELETLPVNSILLAILFQWKRGCQVTVHRFCEVSKAMGNIQVTVYMEEEAQQWARLQSQRDEDRSAFVMTLPRGSEEMSCQTANSQSQGAERESYHDGRPQNEDERPRRRSCQVTRTPNCYRSQRQESTGESYHGVRSQKSKAESPQRRSGQVTPDCYNECEDFEDKLKTAVTQTQETPVLRDKTTHIAQYMNPTEIIPHLFEQQLLTQGQLDDLHSLHETKAKNMYIVQKVSSQGRKGVSSFIECLRATANEVPAHGDLADELESSLL